MKAWMKIILIIGIFVFVSKACYADEWLVTAYCACKKCCGKYSDGVFASGKKVYEGGCAVNWLPFGTKITIDGKLYTVEDRGAISLFGTKSLPIKHVDIYMSDHNKALKWGRKYLDVVIM